MKVENLNGYANQFVITDDFYSKVFQSYKTKIVEYREDTGELYLNSNNWDYSVTTRRHFKAFINEYTPFTYKDKAQWEKEIKSNENIEVIQ